MAAAADSHMAVAADSLVPAAADSRMAVAADSLVPAAADCLPVEDRRVSQRPSSRSSRRFPSLVCVCAFLVRCFVFQN